MLCWSMPPPLPLPLLLLPMVAVVMVIAIDVSLCTHCSPLVPCSLLFFLVSGYRSHGIGTNQNKTTTLNLTV
jgi:hypothetical protein